MLTVIFLLLILSLVLSAFFSASETAILTLNRFKLEHMIKAGNRRAERLRDLRMKPDRFLAAVLVGNNFVNSAAASLATFLFSMMLGSSAETIFLATVTTAIMLLIFSEITPKTIATRHPERFGFLLFQPIRAAMWLMTPFVMVITKVTQGILRLFGQDPTQISDKLSEEEFRAILKVGAEESEIAQTRKKMLSRILEMSNKTLKDLMIPRTMVTMINADAGPAKAVEIAVTSGYSRIPVYSGSEDNVIGVAHVKDLLGLLHRGETPSVTRVLRKPFFVPSSSRLEMALSEFQKAKVHLGVVVDEYGGVEGIVTLEDLLEEIVGEIQDEYDEESDFIRPQPDGSFLIDGGTAIYKLKERLGLGWEEEQGITTIAGTVLSRLGRIPKEKEAIEIESGRLVVEKVQKRKIVLLRLVPTSPTPGERENSDDSPGRT